MHRVLQRAPKQPAADPVRDDLRVEEREESRLGDSNLGGRSFGGRRLTDGAVCRTFPHSTRAVKNKLAYDTRALGH